MLRILLLRILLILQGGNYWRLAPLKPLFMSQCNTFIPIYDEITSYTAGRPGRRSDSQTEGDEVIGSH